MLNKSFKKSMKKEEVEIQESGGPVLYKKGDDHIEKYGEDSFALYKNGKKSKYYTSLEAAKEAMNEEVEELDEISKKTLGSYINKAASNIADKSAEAQHKRTKAVVDYDDNIRRGMSKKGADTHLNRGYDSARPDINKVNSRMQGVQKAISRLAKEEVEELDEKNVPTSPEKWAQAKSQAKAKFDVYPSAYANGWAAKKYKEMGGGWKSVSEETKPPFEGPYTKAKGTITDKSGAKHTPMSRVRDIARMAMKKQVEKMKKPVKEEASMKAKIVKDVMKKKKEKVSDETFQKDPVISNTQVKM
jgi:uncharacterized protein YecT (DUF1311 family)